MGVTVQVADMVKVSRWTNGLVVPVICDVRIGMTANSDGGLGSAKGETSK